MTQRQQWGIVAGIVLLLAGVLAAGVHFLGDELFPVSVGSKAPPIEGVTLDGKKMPKTLADYKDKVVLLNVWATWCEPCRDTLPVYTELARQYAARGLKVYALSVDEDARAIEPFLEENDIQVPVLLDTNAQVAEGALGVRVMPTSYLIDRRGVVRHVHEGAMGDTASLLQRYRGEIEALLAE